MIRDYVALDLEMTGLSPRKDAILEIGAVKVRDMEVMETYTAMVNPGFPVPEHVTKLTGITTEMAQQGREIHTVLPEFLEFCGQSVILGHNIGFDFGFLQQNAANMGKTFPDMAIDTLAIARKFLPELPSRKLGDLCDHYQIREERWHRACDDADAASRLYQKLAEAFSEENETYFEPKKLTYKVRKDAPATKIQKVYLNDLMKYHKIETNVALDLLTRSQASRLTDRIILQYGKMIRGD